ncbi:MAG: hypothetical protein J0M16_08580 [Gammaproteobacteria bacterium]|nr:hypothetical protein [Gammaproteobacteria bacterium]
MVTREQVLLTLERHRATPGAPLDESHFLDHLLANPAGRGAVRNSFEGKRRFNRFIDDIELDAGICFSQADLERAHSLDTFVARANVLAASSQGSLASLANRERAGAGWKPVLVLDFILVCVGLGLWRTPVAAAVLLGLALLLTAAFAVFARHWRGQLTRLRARIRELHP